MRTIKKSDIIFNLDTKHVYVQDFNAKFFTVNETDYYIDYSSADVVATEKEGEIIYSLNLDWKRLRNVGKGVLIFKCINNIPDEDFPDGSYNNEYKVTTDYFIDTFEVEPEEHESIIELIEEETENRISGDTFLSGAIDTLDTKVETYKEETDAAISAETDNRIAADGVLSAAVDTLDAKVESYKDATDEAITGLENALQEEASARSAADTYLSGAIDTLDTKVETYKEATDNAISAETDNRIAADGVISGALDSHSADTSLHFSGVEKENLDSLATNIAAISGITSGDVEQWNKQFDDAKYEMSGQTHVINFYHGNVIKATIDATDFIVDGMVENVVISGGNLVITFNTDSGKQPITIPLTDIFDPSNYYTKTETDTLLSAKADTATTYTKTEVDSALANKADTSAVTEAITAAVSGKADASAVTEEITAAVSGKQDTLVSGTNIKTINNESILGSGNIDIQGGGSNVISLTQAEYDALETIDPDALYVISDATEVDMSNYYTKVQTNTLLSAKADTATTYTKSEVDEMFDNIDLSDYYTKEETDGIVSGKADLSYVEDVEETVARAINDLNDSISGKADASAVTEEISAAVSGKQDTLVSGTNIKTINNTSILGSGNIDIQGGGSVTIDPTLDSGSTNPVANSAITTNINYIKAEAAAIGGDSFWPSSNQNLIGFGIKSLNGGSTSCVEAFVGNGLIKTDTRYLNVNFTNELTSASTTTQVPSAKAVYDAIQSGYVTTDTEQTISGRKIFTYSNNSGKAIEFKQTSDSAKVGFSIKNTADTNNEVASFEFRPNTFTIDGVQHPLMYFGHYRNNNTAKAGVPQTVIGFRQYDQANAAAFHYLIPLPEKAKTPFSLTTSFKDFYAPLGFKNGETIIKADETGVVDMTLEFMGKVDTDTYTAYTAATDTTLAGKADTSAVTDAITAAVSGKQDTLVSGTNIKTINNESILGSGNINIQGGSSYTAGSGIDITNDVISVTGKVDTDTYTAYTAATDSALAGKADTATTYTKSEVYNKTEMNTSLSGKADTSRLGGLSLVQLTQAEYDALATKDSNTLYVIVG